MKILYKFFQPFIIGLIFLVACASNTPNEEINTEVNCYSVVGSHNYSIQADGDEINIELLNYDNHVSFLSSKNWCKAKIENKDGKDYLQLIIEPNTDEINRTAGVILSSNLDCPNIELTIQQLGITIEDEPGESNFGSLKVSSYNIRYASSADIETGNGWDVRKQHVANLIGTHNFDIVGTQEGNDAQLADLKGYLPEYNFVGHPYGGSNNNSHNNAIFYKKEKYEVIDKGVFWFSEAPDIPSIGWDASDQRICYWAKFKELETNLEFYFFNVHFYWRNQTAKLNSGPLLAAKVQEIAGDAPAICTGDFNSPSTSPQINAILTVLKDAYDITETPPVGPVDTNLGGGVFSGEPNGRIDYIFVSDHFKVKNYAVLADTYNDGRYPSDHLPVSAELSIKLD
ncbi:MAG: hypothetical protein GX363_05725 [Clostridiales bacterium]|nr:hypothetical protein [Clostridiales bacterium]